MKLTSAARVLYSVQFHPEMSKFKPESGDDDDGDFGRRFLIAFCEEAKRFWNTP
ncbi:MAG: hypothetical protein NVS3B10_07790 [Polyangiales bacterium]